MIIRLPITAGAFIVALAAGFAALSYELGRRTDRVQASSRIGEAIRERVPQTAVDKIESTKAVQTVKPVVGRIASVGRSVFSAGTSAVSSRPSSPESSGELEAAQPDPTEVMDLSSHPAGNPPPPPANAKSSTPPPPPPGATPSSSQDDTIIDTTDPALLNGATGAVRAGDGPNPDGTLNAETVKPSVTHTPVVQTGRADDTSTSSMPVDQIGWASPNRPQVSGDGVWVEPEETPDGEAGEDGQFRLWD